MPSSCYIEGVKQYDNKIILKNLHIYVYIIHTQTHALTKFMRAIYIARINLIKFNINSSNAIAFNTIIP